MIKEKNGQQVLNPDFFEFSATDPFNPQTTLRSRAVSIGQIRQMLNTAKNAADTRKKIWELMVMHEFDGNTNTATVFHKIANQLDQDKRLIYKAIKNVQKMMKIEDE